MDEQQMDDRRLDALIREAAPDTEFVGSPEVESHLEALADELQRSVTMDSPPQDMTSASTIVDLKREPGPTDRRARAPAALAAVVLLVVGFVGLSAWNNARTGEEETATATATGEGPTTTDGIVAPSEEARTSTSESDTASDVESDRPPPAPADDESRDSTDNRAPMAGLDRFTPSEQGWFGSPSGNVLCRGAIGCEVKVRSWENREGERRCALDEFGGDWVPSDVYLYYGEDQPLGNGGACITDCSSVHCIWRGDGSPDPDVFEYGSWALLGGDREDNRSAVLCTSTESGISCINGFGGVLIANRDDQPAPLRRFWAALADAGEDQDDAAIRALAIDDLGDRKVADALAGSRFVRGPVRVVTDDGWTTSFLSKEGDEFIFRYERGRGDTLAAYAEIVFRLMGDEYRILDAVAVDVEEG